MTFLAEFNNDKSKIIFKWIFALLLITSLSKCNISECGSNGIQILQPFSDIPISSQSTNLSNFNVSYSVHNLDPNNTINLKSTIFIQNLTKSLSFQFRIESNGFLNFEMLTKQIQLFEGHQMGNQSCVGDESPISSSQNDFFTLFPNQYLSIEVSKLMSC